MKKSKDGCFAMKFKYHRVGKRWAILLLMGLFLFFFSITQSISRAPEDLEMKIPQKVALAATEPGFAIGQNWPMEALGLDSETIGGIAAASLEAVASLTGPIL